MAVFAKPPVEPESPGPVEKVATPHTSTIEDLARLLDVPTRRTAKAVFFTARFEQPEGVKERFIFAVVRGDMEVNEYKLSNVLAGAHKGALLELRPATEAEIKAVGAAPGYASPLGLRRWDGMWVVVDDAVPASPNLVAGANEEGYHLLHTNYGRDYEADVVADIAAADEGALCAACGAPLRMSRGVEVGNIFKLGTRYSDALGCTFLDENGGTQAVIMGSYGIGVGRLLACIAEEYHDDLGLIWPVSVAPYPVHLVLLSGKSGLPDTAAVELGAAPDPGRFGTALR